MVLVFTMASKNDNDFSSNSDDENVFAFVVMLPTEEKVKQELTRKRKLNPYVD